MSDRRPLIFVLLDGLSARDAHRCAGVLGAFVEAGLAAYGELDCELPSLSRPLYECLFTGKKPTESGVLSNGERRGSRNRSIFSMAREAGVGTAAAAYHWVSELYTGDAFIPEDRIRLDPDSALRGIFYFEDDYPDSHVLADGEFLRRSLAPDFLLIHTMNVDLAGHRYGRDSRGYRNAVRRIDELLSAYLPRWLGDGCDVLITSDHGMGIDGCHGGDTEEERKVPLWLLGRGFAPSLPEGLPIPQAALCGTCCRALGIDPGDLPVRPELLRERES